MIYLQIFCYLTDICHARVTSNQICLGCPLHSKDSLDVRQELIRVVDNFARRFTESDITPTPSKLLSQKRIWRIYQNEVFNVYIYLAVWRNFMLFGSQWTTWLAICRDASKWFFSVKLQKDCLHQYQTIISKWWWH